MDLHLLDAEPTPAERAAVDDLLGLPASGWEGGRRRAAVDGRLARGGHEARGRRDELLPALHAVQSRFGWISPGALNYVCKRLTVPPADAYGVATFYALFSLDQRPPRIVHVCDDLACACNGADALVEELERHVGPEGSVAAVGEGACTWYRSPCLGQCDRAPAALLTHSGDPCVEHVLAPIAAHGVLAALDGTAVSVDPPATVPQHGDPSLRLLRRVGVVDPRSLDEYRAHGGYAALRRAFELGPEGVIREVVDSKLMGRGGAAFPTGRKWDAVARQPSRPHYLVCNADESEPGTFKDRALMEGDPYGLVEAMTIAGYATGCERGYVYLRGEYPQAHELLGHALAEARARGFLGANILGHGFDFEIGIRKGAGAYICGEETAIFNSIEGFRGEPRNKPPFPVQEGLFGKPTVVNNVETIVNVLEILRVGGPRFAAVGTEGSTGPKLFCVSGCVERPGVYEVEFGATLAQLLELAGGVRAARPLQAVLLGGAAGGFVGPHELEVELTFEGAREARTTLGSGVAMVFDDTVDLGRSLGRIAAFFRDESCGQCVPCRVGTVRQEEALARLLSGRVRGSVDDELALIAEMGQCMRDASICGLGQTASSAIESAIGRLGMFRDGGDAAALRGVGDDA
jgi:NADH-quinone oxidoreductase subunit F